MPNPERAREKVQEQKDKRRISRAEERAKLTNSAAVRVFSRISEKKSLEDLESECVIARHASLLDAGKRLRKFLAYAQLMSDGDGMVAVVLPGGKSKNRKSLPKSNSGFSGSTAVDSKEDTRWSKANSLSYILADASDDDDDDYIIVYEENSDDDAPDEGFCSEAAASLPSQHCTAESAWDPNEFDAFWDVSSARQICDRWDNPGEIPRARDQ